MPLFANPEVQSFVDHLIGGGTPSPGGGVRGSVSPLAAALAGMSGSPRPEMATAYPAPAIRPGFRPEAGQGGGPRGMINQSVTPVPSIGSSAGGLGGNALAAGIGKLGQGIEGALGDFAAKRAQQQAYADAMASAPPRPAPFGAPPRPAPFGSTPDASGDLPTFAQSGTSPSTGTGTYSPLEGMSPSQARAYNFFTSKGWSPNFSIAMTAALTGESTPGLNTSPLQGNDARTGGGNGIANWSASRWSALGRPQGLDNQLNAVFNEVHSQYPRIAGLTSSNADPAALTNMITGGLNDGGKNGSPFAGSYLTPQDANGFNRWQAFTKVSGLRGPPEDTTSAALAGGVPAATAADVAQDARQDAESASATPAAVVKQGTYNGQPYTYQTQPALGQQGMNDQAPSINPLALALAGQGDPNNPQMSPEIVALLNSGVFGFGGANA